MGGKPCASLSSGRALPPWSHGLPNPCLCVRQPPNSEHLLLHLFPTSLGRGSPLTTAPYRRGAPWGADHLTPEQAQVTEESHGSEPHEMMHVKVLCKQQAFVTVGVKVLCEQQAPHRLIRLSPVGQALPCRTSWLSDPGKSPSLSGTWFSYSGKGITSAPLPTAHESLE